MGINPEDTVRKLSGAPEAQPSAPLTQSQGGLRAQQLIDSRVTTLHADVAARAAQRFEELHPLPDQKLQQAIHDCILCLTFLAKENALTIDPVPVELNLPNLVGLAPESGRARVLRRIQEVVEMSATLSIRSMEIGILLEGLALVSEHPGLDKVTKGASRVLIAARDLINSGTLPGAKAAQRYLESNRGVLTSTASDLLAILDDTKPERREALRKSYIDQTVDKEDTNYRISLEHKALKLLSLVQERHEHRDVRPAQVRMARKLLSLGFDKVEQTLRDLTPTLRLEDGDVSELQEIFDAAKASESSKKDASEPVEQGPTKRSLKQNAVARKAGNIKPPCSTEGEDTYRAPPAPEDADTIAYKEYLLEELGVNDPDIRASISKELRLEGVENICSAFDGIRREVVRAILGANPNLISPSSGENLLSFTSELRGFLHDAYDFAGYDLFDPSLTPENFTSLSQLKRTRAKATVLRRAIRNVEQQGRD